MSPHVFEPSGTQFHYKMPINAITSILNRVTGTALTVGALSHVTPATRLRCNARCYACARHGCPSHVWDTSQSSLVSGLESSGLACMHAGFTGAGAIALAGDLPATVETIKSFGPMVVYPLRAVVAFPVVYHYLGGVRHVFWDKAKYGQQVRHHGPTFLLAALLPQTRRACASCCTVTDA